MASDQKKFDMILLTGLWKSQTGMSLSGFLGKSRLVIVPNTKKTDEKQPDYLAFIAPSEPRDKKPDGENTPF